MNTPVNDAPQSLETEGRLPRRWRRILVWGLVLLAVVWLLSVVLEWLTQGDGLPELDLGSVAYPYLIIAGFVTFDAIVPILPSESLLNAASTLASQGVLELGYIIIGGAIGAIVGDSMLYWLARTIGRRIAAGKLEQVTANKKVAAAQEVLGETAPLIIVAGRFVPGLRFVVGATMGLNRYPYPKFLMWSTLGSALWAAYTCAFSWWIGTKLGDWPIISMLTSALITFLLIGLLYFPLKRRWADVNAQQPAES